MSRKSKRRRMRNADGTLRAQGPGDGFEFLDDRGQPAGDDGFVAPPRPAAAEADAGTATATATAAVVTAAAPGVAAQGPATAVADASADPSPAAEPEPVVEPVATLGEMLTTARLARGLSIEEASARTRIAPKMLQHLENDRFGEFAAEAYLRGFLRSYGNLLGLDVAILMARYEALVGRHVAPAPSEWTADVEPARQAPRPAHPQRGNTVAGIAVAAVAVLTVVGIVLSERGAFELRPAAGLQQIENELRQAQPTPAAPAASTETATNAASTPPAATLGGSPPAPIGAALSVPAVAGSAASAASAAHDPASSISAEDTAPGPLASRPKPADLGLSDLVEESLPAPLPAVQAEDALPRAAAPADGALVLTATARDSCTLRLQIDADARHAQRYAFTRPGESRAWTAKSSFRVLARNAAQLELRLNGQLIAVPAEGRTVVLDRGTLRGDKPAVPARTVRRGGRRSRARSHAAAPAPASNAASSLPQNAAGPP